MFVILDDKTICLTRGDIAHIDVTAQTQDGSNYAFKSGDVVRLQVFERKNCANVVLSKSVEVTEQTESVQILLTRNDTRIGDVINKPVDYWYEVELNPETSPQTIIGYDESGEKIFRLYPEGCEAI